METLNLTKEQKDIVVKEFLSSVNSWEDCLMLTQFVLLKLSKEAIKMNAAETVLSQDMEGEGKRYMTRMTIQWMEIGKRKSLEERAYELADRMLSTGSANCDIREELKRAILVGYNMHHEDFDDEELEDNQK